MVRTRPSTKRSFIKWEDNRDRQSNIDLYQKEIFLNTQPTTFQEVSNFPFFSNGFVSLKEAPPP
jgi:hypothetical protein